LQIMTTGGASAFITCGETLLGAPPRPTPRRFTRGRWAFTAWMTGYLTLAWVMRSQRTPPARLGLWSNRFLPVWTAITAAALAVIVAARPVRAALGLTTLSPAEWVLVTAAPVAAVAWLEAAKWLAPTQAASREERHRGQGQPAAAITGSVSTQGAAFGCQLRVPPAAAPPEERAWTEPAADPADPTGQAPDPQPGPHAGRIGGLPPSGGPSQRGQHCQARCERGHRPGPQPQQAQAQAHQRQHRHAGTATGSPSGGAQGARAVRPAESRAARRQDSTTRNLRGCVCEGRRLGDRDQAAALEPWLRTEPESCRPGLARGADAAVACAARAG
jgi:hypothetical protein